MDPQGAKGNRHAKVKHDFSSLNQNAIPEALVEESPRRRSLIESSKEEESKPKQRNVSEVILSKTQLDVRVERVQSRDGIKK